MKTLLLLSVALLCGVMFAQETTNEMRTVVIKMLCKCGGEMKPTNTVLNSNPPQYVHACDRCKKTAEYFVTYPSIRYEVSK